MYLARIGSDKSEHGWCLVRLCCSSTIQRIEKEKTCSAVFASCTAPKTGFLVMGLVVFTCIGQMVVFNIALFHSKYSQIQICFLLKKLPYHKYLSLLHLYTYWQHSRSNWCMHCGLSYSLPHIYCQVVLAVYVLLMIDYTAAVRLWSATRLLCQVVTCRTATGRLCLQSTCC